MGIWSLLIVGYLAVAIAVIIAVLRHRRDPTAMLAWILAAVAVPYLSGALYLLFGENRVRRRARRRRRRITERVVHLTQLVREQTGHIHDEGRPRVPTHLAPVEQVGRRMADMPVTSDNEITLFDDAERTFASMEDAI